MSQQLVIHVTLFGTPGLPTEYGYRATDRLHRVFNDDWTAPDYYATSREILKKFIQDAGEDAVEEVMLDNCTEVFVQSASGGPVTFDLEELTKIRDEVSNEKAGQ